MPEAVIVDALRTPIGRAFKGSLTQVRPDDLAAFVVDQMLERNPDVDPATVEDLIRLGREVERRVLARAVRWHLEGRVLVDGNRTVVFE